MELIVKTFSLLKNYKIYLFGDFNINLLQKGNCILNRKGMAACQGPVHTLINKYRESCLIFSLRQLITSRTVRASNICLKDKNKMVFNATKNLFIFKIIFEVLCKTWHLRYLFHLIFLLNLNMHPTMTITHCQKIWNFNF